MEEQLTAVLILNSYSTDGTISLSIYTTLTCKNINNILPFFSHAIEVYLDSKLVTDREPCRFVYSAGVIGNSLNGLEPFGFLRDFRIYGNCLLQSQIKNIFIRKEE